MDRKPKAPFTIEEVRAAFKYDAETGIILRIRNGAVAGSRRKRGYINISFRGKNVLAHRLAWAISKGEWPMTQIDHINGDHSDNRICNLRLASQTQNMANVGPRSYNRSGLKGISLTEKGRWRAGIGVAGTRKYLGVFANKADALDAYNKAAREAYGDFAKLSELMMNAPLRTPFGTRLAADYDHHGIRLDLYGTLGELGYEVKHVCIPGTPIALTECVSPDALYEMGAKLDDMLPTSEELIKEARDGARVDEQANFDLNVRLFGYSGMG